MAVATPAKAEPAVELLETRHVRDAFEAMPVKTDRKGFRSAADHHATAAVLRSLAAGT